MHLQIFFFLVKGLAFMDKKDTDGWFNTLNIYLILFDNLNTARKSAKMQQDKSTPS